MKLLQPPFRAGSVTPCRRDRIDRTFDLNLDFTVDESMSSEGPTIFEAVQRQLGLKLETRKGPVQVVVIDHVEKPSAN